LTRGSISFRKDDGLPGHKRVYARLQRAMPGNDENPYMIDAYAGLRTAANCGECMGSAVRVLVE
jgi:hypothetical protein